MGYQFKGLEKEKGCVSNAQDGDRHMKLSVLLVNKHAMSSIGKSVRFRLYISISDSMISVLFITRKGNRLSFG